LLIDATKTPLQEPTDAERAASHQLAERLAWQLPDGSPAGSEQIDEEWDNVKAMMDLAPQGGGTFKSRTSLRIDDDEVDRVVFEKLDEMESVLIGREPFAGFEDFPADAQLGLSACRGAWARISGSRSSRRSSPTATGPARPPSVASIPT
jgi:hypothetical protein